MNSGSPIDLIVLLPGRDDEAALQSLLRRPDSLGVRAMTFATRVHPRRDPGCFRESHTFLRLFLRECTRALVVFDRDGCGQAAAAEELEAQVRDRLAANGWGDRADAVVIDPELESWVWADSPHVERHLGWLGRTPPLREWLRGRGIWEDTPKPHDPKRAVEAALWEAKVQRSSTIYAELAADVGIEGCRDAAFARFRAILRRWFGV